MVHAVVVHRGMGPGTLIPLFLRHFCQKPRISVKIRLFSQIRTRSDPLGLGQTQCRPSVGPSVVPVLVRCGTSVGPVGV